MQEILLILGLILLNGLFSMAEIALVSARKARLEAQANKGDKRAKEALELANHPDTFLSTVQIGITLIGILTGILSGEKLKSDFASANYMWVLFVILAYLFSNVIRAHRWLMLIKTLGKRGSLANAFFFYHGWVFCKHGIAPRRRDCSCRTFRTL